MQKDQNIQIITLIQILQGIPIRPRNYYKNIKPKYIVITDSNDKLSEHLNVAINTYFIALSCVRQSNYDITTPDSGKK